MKKREIKIHLILTAALMTLAPSLFGQTAVYFTANPKPIHLAPKAPNYFVYNHTYKRNQPSFSLGIQHQLHKGLSVFAEVKSFGHITESYFYKAHEEASGNFWSALYTSGNPNNRTYQSETTSQTVLIGLSLTKKSMIHKYKHGIELGAGQQFFQRKSQYQKSESQKVFHEYTTARRLNISFMYISQLGISDKLNTHFKLGFSNTPVQLGLSYQIRD